MRTLEINKTKLWKVTPLSKVEIVDENGFLTGEYTTTFSTPVIIYIGLYPANGKIKTELFGKDYQCDKLALSNKVVLTQSDLLFLSTPVSNYESTYDYRIDKINESLNTYNYALRNRT
jgi:hypothetical protein